MNAEMHLSYVCNRAIHFSFDSHWRRCRRPESVMKQTILFIALSYILLSSYYILYCLDKASFHLSFLSFLQIRFDWRFFISLKICSLCFLRSMHPGTYRIHSASCAIFWKSFYCFSPRNWHFTFFSSMPHQIYAISSLRAFSLSLL